MADLHAKLNAWRVYRYDLMLERACVISRLREITVELATLDKQIERLEKEVKPNLRVVK